MRTYDDWITELDSEQNGRLWLRKLRYDLSNNNIPADIEETLKSKLEAKLPTVAKSKGKAKLPTSASLEALAVVEAVINENPKSFDLKGLRVPPNGQQYSLIVKLEVFAYYYLNQRILTKLDESEDPLDDIWKNLGKPIIIKSHKGWVKTDREFFWCAPKSTIERIVTGYRPNRAATIIRDRLGLHKMEKGKRLVLIDIPPDALVAKKLCAPTTLDSGVNPIFVPFNNPDGYGRTLNLRTNTRDVREVVVEKIPFNKTFGSARIGRVGAKVPSISWADIESLVS